jgi:hypothetical protein
VDILESWWSHPVLSIIAITLRRSNNGGEGGRLVHVTDYRCEDY